MLKFVIPQPGSTTVNLYQTGAAKPRVFGASVVANLVDLRKYPILLSKPRVSSTVLQYARIRTLRGHTTWAGCSPDYNVNSYPFKYT